MLIARSVHPKPGESERKERLLALIDGFSNRRVLVVGDIIADEFIYGEVARVSREAPVLILKYGATEMVAGGAGNAANNVAALGGRARLVGVVGADPEGRRLLSSFHRGVDCSHIVRAREYRTPVKTRILAGGIHSAKQQIVRIDREVGWPLADSGRRAYTRKIRSALDGCDAVILSDYGSGLVTPALADLVRRTLERRSRRRPVPVLVDSRYRLLDYRGFTTCTPNESEVEQVVGIRVNDNAGALEQAGRRLLQRTRMGAVLVTRGGRGMALFEPRQPTVHIPIFGSDEVADVTGAGDTVIAAVGLALAAGASFYEAARLANYAGGLVVMKRGTATVSAQEMAEAVTSDHDTSPESWSQEGPAQGTAEELRIQNSEFRITAEEIVGRVLSESELVAAVADDRVAGRTIAFANGCFDLLHVGHVRYLQGAAAEADRLIVAVNDDASVARSKGPGRPAIPAGERAEIIAAIGVVDYVVTFADDTVERLLGRIKPDVHCKGTDYTVDTVPERAVVQAYGGRTAIVGDPKHHASRDVAKRIRAASDQRPMTND